MFECWKRIAELEPSSAVQLCPLYATPMQEYGYPRRMLSRIFGSGTKHEYLDARTLQDCTTMHAAAKKSSRDSVGKSDDAAGNNVSRNRCRLRTSWSFFLRM